MNDYIEGKKYVIHRFSEDREICVVKKERLLYIYENGLKIVELLFFN